MTIEQAIVFIAFPIVGYLLGSIPFGFVIGKINGVDIRTVGSKNIGATNLGRTLGAKFFWMAFLLDAAKGFVRCWSRHSWCVRRCPCGRR